MVDRGGDAVGKPGCFHEGSYGSHLTGLAHQRLADIDIESHSYEPEQGDDGQDHEHEPEPLGHRGSPYLDARFHEGPYGSHLTGFAHSDGRRFL